MEEHRPKTTFLVSVIAGFVCAAAGAQVGPVIPNWPVPPYHQGIHAMGDVTSPLPFIGLAPCRLADTRGNGFAGAYGPPSLTAGAPRSFTLTGQCGIPASATAVSLNVTVDRTTGPGFILIYPQGGTQPLVSTVNYAAGQTIANAAIVPLGSGGITVIAGVSGTDLVLDTNGYFSDTPGNQANYLTINNNSILYSLTTTNASSSCSGICGIRAQVAHGYAVGGVSLGTGGTNIGVYGTTQAVLGGSAGVFGLDGSGEPGGSLIGFVSGGVRGDSKSNVGVIGVSEATAVDGDLVNGAGTTIAAGELGAAFGTAFDSTTGPWGVFAFGNSGATGSKHFVEPHPSDPGKVILYSSLEGREVGTYFRGTAKVVDHQAVIEVPEDFRIVTAEDGLTVQLTPVGAFAQMYVEGQDLGRIVVRSSRDVTFHYLVQGVRKAFRDFQPVAAGGEFVPRSAADRMPAYLTEEAKARLISNGTYNADGTVNMATAEREGWTKIWAVKEAASAKN